MTSIEAFNDLTAATYAPDLTDLDDTTTPEGEDPTPTWGRIDLSDVLNGTWSAPEATRMQRTDGNHLLYEGKVHSFQGESESGKSFLAQAESARTLMNGGRVLYLDFESDQGTVVNRMLAMGTPPAAIRDRLDYRRPDQNPALLAELDTWREMLSTPTDLAIIDGVTEAFSVFGVNSMDNDEVTTWGRQVPRKIAERTGAAVVVIDHVTKSAEGRGRFAIGAQAKMSYLTGASYSIEVKTPLGVGMRGVLSMRVGKDRPGRVRPISGAYRASDRSQEAAQVVIDSTDPERIHYELQPPIDGSASAASGFRPTTLMEKLSEAFEAATTMTVREYRAAVTGKNDAKTKAVDVLLAEGYLIKVSEKLTHSRRYRQSDDPQSDKFTGE